MPLMLKANGGDFDSDIFARPLAPAVEVCLLGNCCDLPQSRRRHVQPESGPEKAFGKALQEFRKASDVSQERLGLSAGLDRTCISLVVRGLRSPTIRTVALLA